MQRAFRMTEHFKIKPEILLHSDGNFENLQIKRLPDLVLCIQNATEMHRHFLVCRKWKQR